MFLGVALHNTLIMVPIDFWQNSGGIYLPCWVNSTSDWLPRCRHCVPAPVLWPIGSQNSRSRSATEFWLVRTLGMSHSTQYLASNNQSKAQPSRNDTTKIPLDIYLSKKIFQILNTNILSFLWPILIALSIQIIMFGLFGVQINYCQAQLKLQLQLQLELR